MLRRRGEAVPAGLISRKSWVRIPPALRRINVKVEYKCSKCDKVFIVDRVGYLDRDKCWQELLKIGDDFLFPHVVEHDAQYIRFDGCPGKDYDMVRCKILQDEIGVCLCYSLMASRTDFLD